MPGGVRASTHVERQVIPHPERQTIPHPVSAAMPEGMVTIHTTPSAGKRRFDKVRLLSSDHLCTSSKEPRARVRQSFG